MPIKTSLNTRGLAAHECKFRSMAQCVGPNKGLVRNVDSLVNTFYW